MEIKEESKIRLEIEFTKEDRKKFGETLVKARQLNSLSQKEVRERFGISQTWLSFLEKGRNLPTLEMLLKLLRFYNLKPYQFFLMMEDEDELWSNKESCKILFDKVYNKLNSNILE